MKLWIFSCAILLSVAFQIPIATMAQDLPPAPTDPVPQSPTDSVPQPAVDSDPQSPVEPAGDLGKTDQPAKKPAFDASVISQGQASFQANCTECHDADLSLQKQKSLNGWRNTVRRMAALDGASIPEGEWEAISIYLTSVHRGSDATVAETTTAMEHDAEERFSVYGTLSPTFRAGPGDIDQRGFFPETWLGVSFQPKGFVSARATVCLTCHRNDFDLVEAAVRFDFMQLVEPQCRGGWHASVDAGRLIVPFGAFSSQVNPGVFRTVTRPLIFSMGMRVLDGDLGAPVLPMPYSDEGANLNFGVPLTETIDAHFDGYVVNGLQGSGTGVNFFSSLAYFDNNRSPAIGSRLTVGNQNVKLGGSIMGGRFANYPNAPPVDSGLTYLIFGADLTVRYEDLIRVQFEYAQRDTDRVVNLPGVLIDRESVGGCYVEAEVLVSRQYKISALARYDNQARSGLLAPPGSSLATGDFSVSRFTWGFNWSLPGGSLLMVNHEYWKMPNGLPDANVVGLRWAATF